MSFSIISYQTGGASTHTLTSVVALRTLDLPSPTFGTVLQTVHNGVLDSHLSLIEKLFLHQL